jgi:hypothetical protein
MKSEKESKNVAKRFYTDIKKVCSIILESRDNNSRSIRSCFDGETRNRLNDIYYNIEWFNFTGLYKQPLKRRERYMQFWHLILCCPHKTEGYAFSVQDRVVARYKEEIDLLIRHTLGENGKYVLGYQIRPHFGFKDSQAAGVHFHCTISKIRIPLADKQYAKNLSKLPEDERPLHALYLLSESMTYRQDELAGMFRDGWLRVISKISKMSLRELMKQERQGQGLVRDGEEEDEISDGGDDADDGDDSAENTIDRHRELLGDLPIVTATSKPGQNSHDRDKLAIYNANQAAHTFRHIRPKLINDRPGQIRIEYMDADGNPTGKGFTMNAIKFICQYLLTPNRSRKLRHFAKGFMHSRSPFAGAIDALQRLAIRPNEGGEGDDSGGKSKRVIDLPIQFIRSRAIEFRNAYLSGDAARIQAVKDQYHVLPAMAEQTTKCGVGMKTSFTSKKKSENRT